MKSRRIGVLILAISTMAAATALTWSITRVEGKSVLGLNAKRYGASRSEMAIGAMYIDQVASTPPLAVTVSLDADDFQLFGSNVSAIVSVDVPANRALAFSIWDSYGCHDSFDFKLVEGPEIKPLLFSTHRQVKFYSPPVKSYDRAVDCFAYVGQSKSEYSFTQRRQSILFVNAQTRIDPEYAKTLSPPLAELARATYFGRSPDALDVQFGVANGENLTGVQTFSNGVLFFSPAHAKLNMNRSAVFQWSDEIRGQLRDVALVIIGGLFGTSISLFVEATRNIRSRRKRPSQA